MSQRDEWIAARAYELWEKAGRPHGQDVEHWRDASDEWEERHAHASGDDRPQEQSVWDDDGEE